MQTAQRRLSSIVSIAVALTAMSWATAFSSDWPQFRGPNGDGVSPEKLTNRDWKNHPPKLLWKTSMSDDGYAGASVAGGKVFIVDHKGQTDIVRAIDIKTGKDMWRAAYEDAKNSSYGFCRCSPAISQGRVYTYSLRGKANCFDAATGKKLWSRDLSKDYPSQDGKEYSMSPLVDGNRVIYMTGGKAACVVALDRTTGRTIWQGGTDVIGFSTPMKAKINGKLQYVVFAGTSLLGLDAQTGNVLWSVPWKTIYNDNVAQPVVFDSKIYISSLTGCALIGPKDAGADIVWQNEAMKCMFCPPMYYQGNVYAASEPHGELVCLDPLTGALKWSQKGFGQGPGVLIDGLILNLDSKSGDMVMVKPSPDSYQELGRFTPLGGESFTPPAISNGKLIVRNKKTLACFSLN